MKYIAKHVRRTEYMPRAISNIFDNYWMLGLPSHYKLMNNKRVSLVSDNFSVRLISNKEAIFLNIYVIDELFIPYIKHISQ